MRKAYARVLAGGGVLVLLTLLALMDRTGVKASTLKQTHLKGLSGVNVIAAVSREIPDAAKLEADIVQAATTHLARDGNLRAEGPDGVWLTIEVKSYVGDEALREGHRVLLVRVQLSEPVRLERDPALQIPGGNGAVTWATEWVGVSSDASVPAFVLREVETQVGAFAAQVRGVNQAP